MSLTDKYVEVCAERDRLVEQLFAYQLCIDSLPIAELATAQRQLFAVRALHRFGPKAGHRICTDCGQHWPCETRKALDS